MKSSILLQKRLILNRGSDYDKFHSEPFDFYEIPK